MKKLLSLLALLVFVASIATAQKKSAKANTGIKTTTPLSTVKANVALEGTVSSNAPKMEFEQTTIDYGSIKQHADPLRKFSFTNTGNAPLIIKHAKGSCGCTVPKYPKEPIAPGQTAVIEVRYDTKRIGKFTKTVTLTTNEPVQSKRVLTIKGLVNKAAAVPSGIPTKKTNILGGKN